MSEEALQEKESAVGGDGRSPVASRTHMSTRSNFSGHSGPTSVRSLAGAAHRVSMSSISPPTSQRVLNMHGEEEVGPTIGCVVLGFCCMLGLRCQQFTLHSTGLFSTQILVQRSTCPVVSACTRPSTT